MDKFITFSIWVDDPSQRLEENFDVRITKNCWLGPILQHSESRLAYESRTVVISNLINCFIINNHSLIIEEGND